MMTHQPLLLPVPNSKRYMLMKDFELKEYNVLVPRSFLTDGASIPNIFWSLTYPPYHPCIIAGAVVHDWIFLNHQMSQDDANKLLHEIMTRNGANSIKSKMIYEGLKTFGAFAWKRSEQDIQKLKNIYEIIKDLPRFDEYKFPVEVL